MQRPGEVQVSLGLKVVLEQQAIGKSLFSGKKNVFFLSAGGV